MSASANSLRKRLLALSLASLITLILAEMAVQTWFPVRSNIFCLDTELLHSTLPDSRRLLVMDASVGGDRILIEIGPEGYRGRDSIGAKSGARVAVYGDSLVMAENVPLRETFCVRLEAHMRSELGRDVQCVNAGVTGYGPDQALLKLEAELPALDPDLVLFVICAHNDHGDLLRNKLLRLDESGSLLRTQAAPAQELVKRFAQMARDEDTFALLRLWEFWKERRAQREADSGPASRPPPYIQWYLEAAQGEFLDYQKGADLAVYSLFRDYYDADLAIAPECESARAKRGLMGALLLRLRERCRKAGVPLLVLVVPSAVDLDPAFDIHVDPQRYPSYDKRRIDLGLLQQLAELEIEALGFWELFEELGPDKAFVGADDFHWNAVTQDAAAAMIAGQIRDGGQLAR